MWVRNTLIHFKATEGTSFLTLLLWCACGCTRPRPCWSLQAHPGPSPAPREKPCPVGGSLRPPALRLGGGNRGRISGGDGQPCAPGGDRNHRRRAGRDMTPEPSPSIWAPAPARVCAFACSYKCSFMFLKGCILSARCDIFWKEFQRALCKVLNKLLNKIETESGEVKRTFKNVCVHLISPGTAII